MRTRAIAAWILGGGACLLVVTGGKTPWLFRTMVIRKFANFAEGESARIRIESEHCFGSGWLDTRLTKATDGWVQQLETREFDDRGREIDSWKGVLHQPDAIAGTLDYLFRLQGPSTTHASEGYLIFSRDLWIDWNDDGRWDQKWSHQDRIPDNGGIGETLTQGIPEAE